MQAWLHSSFGIFGQLHLLLPILELCEFSLLVLRLGMGESILHAKFLERHDGFAMHVESFKIVFIERNATGK